MLGFSRVLPAGIGLWLSLGGGTAPGLCIPRQAKGKHTTIELISDGRLPAPGNPVWLGLRFRMEPGWHIYWLNPGDSGQPPSIRWQAPHGIAVGSLEWPVPERIVIDPLVNYGYKGEVVFPLPLTARMTWAGDRLSVRAAVRWLICREVCIPDNAEVELSLPVPSAEGSRIPEWSRLIDKARGRVPRPAPPGWRASAQSLRESFLISLEFDKQAPDHAVFFPLETGQIDDSAPQRVERSGRNLRLTLRKSDQLLSIPSIMKGVVTFSSGDAFLVDAPVRSDTPIRSTQRRG